MRAWAVKAPGPIDSTPLELVERPPPEPEPGQIRMRVSVCGVCRTDLHLAEGDLAPRRPGVVPGHEVVGVVDALGEGAGRFALGERAGIAWLRRTCGRCRWCRRGAENLCPDPRFTGWDADGGYAESAVVAPPEPLDSAVLFAPAGDLVPVALAALDRGGTLAVAGIHLSDVPPLDYRRHLFQERQLRSVTANTRADGEEFLALAARLGLRVTTQPYPLDHADRALADLAQGRVTGAAVLR